MKKIIAIIFILILFNSNSNAGSKWGKGELKLDDYVVEKFIEYIRGNTSRSPYLFAVSIDGWGYNYYYCSSGSNCQGGDEQILQECARYSKDVECFLFARKRTIKWKNGINPGKGKASKISSKWSDAEIKSKLTELGFLGSKTTSSSSTNTTTKKVEKKEDTKKTVKKYELKGERSIALSWDGYEDLIAGTVEFDETDYKGNLNLQLPNNDGTCDGTYSLQEGGKGTWQIACTNNMGAAGTLKWNKNGGVTGSGRDHNDKKVKFTVSKKS
tara:strand:- start:1302 stop:2111 length:810 start_codon:yes stop_codon:yes gene_type:complete